MRIICVSTKSTVDSLEIVLINDSFGVIEEHIWN